MSLPDIKHINDLQDMLDRNEPFSFVNYCDGEWKQILGATSGAQCDGQSFTAEGRDLLIDCIRNHRDMYYMTQFHWRDTPICFELFRNLGIGQGIKWFDRNIILHKLWNGEIGPFLSSIKKKKVLIVGPQHMKNIEIIDPVGFVVVPSSNAMSDRTRILNESIEKIEELKPDVVTVSASFLAKVLVHELHKKYGDTKWLLDVGSLWDPFCGVLSRSPYRVEKWTQSEEKIRSYLKQH